MLDQPSARGPAAPPTPTERFVVAPARRPSPWWWAGAVVAGSAYLLVNDPAKGHTFLPCPFRTMTGLDCPMCGATRATAALLRGHVGTALGYNVLWVALIPLVVWAWVTELRGGWATSRHPFRRRWFGIALVVVAVLFAVVRNLPWAPWSALGTTH